MKWFHQQRKDQCCLVPWAATIASRSVSIDAGGVVLRCSRNVSKQPLAGDTCCLVFGNLPADTCCLVGNWPVVSLATCRLPCFWQLAGCLVGNLPVASFLATCQLSRRQLAGCDILSRLIAIYRCSRDLTMIGKPFVSADQKTDWSWATTALQSYCFSVSVELRSWDRQLTTCWSCQLPLHATVSHVEAGTPA